MTATASGAGGRCVDIVPFGDVAVGCGLLTAFVGVVVVIRLLRLWMIVLCLCLCLGLSLSLSLGSALPVSPSACTRPLAQSLATRPRPTS